MDDVVKVELDMDYYKTTVLGSSRRQIPWRSSLEGMFAQDRCS